MPNLVLAENNYQLSQNGYQLSQAPTYASRESLIEDMYIKVPTTDNAGNVTGHVKVREDYFDDLDAESYEAVMDFVEPFNTEAISGIFSKWRERRKTKKDERQARKMEKITARQTGRTERAKVGGGIGGFLNKALSVVTGGESEQMPADETMPYDTRGQFDMSYTTAKPWYQNPWVLGGAALATAGVIYMVTRNRGGGGRKRRRR